MEDFDFMEQLVNPFVTERLGEVFKKDKECQKCLKEEAIIYTKLRKKLPDKQEKQLEDYFTAANATAARKETLTYIQGMKDLLTLLKTIS